MNTSKKDKFITVIVSEWMPAHLKLLEGLRILFWALC